MKIKQGSMQLGKNGVTENFIESLKNCFKYHENVKICLLKNVGHDREKVKKIADEIVEKMGRKYTNKIVGFTIFVKKWRKARI